MMSEKRKQQRRVFTQEFKQNAVDLVVKQGYSFRAAADAVGVAPRSLREWHEKLAPAPAPCGEDAGVEQLTVEVRRLRRQLQRAEMERDILKKATAYFAKESQ